MKIDEAIDILSDNHTVLYSHGDYTEQEENQALSTAIKSLEAWESVKQEIKSNCIFVTYVVKDRTAEGIAEIIDDVLKQAKEQFLDIIDNHLEELEVQ
jgi:hypothetical protein